MRVVDRVADLRAACDDARRVGRRVGLVPTMGCFHEGHRSLMRAARAGDDLVVVTLFVNPLQFGEGEDLGAYPRNRDDDTEVARAENVDVLFVPGVDEIYLNGARTTVRVDGLTEGLCGAARPAHFDGVTTVVAKLFSIVGPCRAYFGRKDAQQLAVITRMTADLNLPVEVVGCPLVREPDGLAMSSRNACLSDDEREAATALFASLRAAVGAVEAGERSVDSLRALVAGTLAYQPELELDYVEIRSADELEPLDMIDGRVLIALAAKVGATRLIDNVTVDVTSGVAADLGTFAARSSPSPVTHRPATPHTPSSSPSSARRTGATVHRTMMKSKIHRATVTGADLDYVGSITVDRRLMQLADLQEHEQVHVLDVDNGARFETYVIEGGPGDIVLNGAAARLVQPGDRVIVISYASYDDAELDDYEPRVIHVDSRNRPTDPEFQQLDRELHNLTS